MSLRPLETNANGTRVRRVPGQSGAHSRTSLPSCDVVASPEALQRQEEPARSRSSKRKVVARSSDDDATQSENETDDGANGQASARPNGGADTSAYALLSLMQSVQKAAQTSADERGRTSDQYKAWKEKGGTAKDKHNQEAKKRKPTSTVRKEEIGVLNEEIQKLEARLAYLRGQTLAPMDRHDDDDGKPQIPNALLREAIHEQQLSLANARSMISQFAATDLSLPAHCYIHLTKSPVERLQTIKAIKHQQLRIARRYVIERSRHINLTVPHAANERFMKENGDACNIRFVIAQFPGTLSVYDIFKAATFYTSNLEISFTDGAGHVTIREDDSDSGDPTMSQHRYLTTVSPQLLVEGNVLLFTHYDEEEDYGIVTSTFVDFDDLHPYRPRERIRQDITAVLMVTREKDLIVVRRLGHVRLHHNEHIPVNSDLLQSLSEGLAHWGEALMKHAKDLHGC